MGISDRQQERQVAAWIAVERISTQALKEGIVEKIVECLGAALDTAEFEKHPFRPWHEQARNLLTQINGE